MTDQVDLGAVTLAVIASSFVSFIAFFHLLDHFRLYAKLQPKHDKVTRKEWGIVARMTLTNLVWLVPGTLLSGPVLEVFLLPYSDPLPWFPASAVKIFVFLFLDDVFFYAYHRLLHSIPALYVAIHKPHHVFTAPFAAAGFCQHPVEMMLQVWESFWRAHARKLTPAADAKAVGATLPFLYSTHPVEFWAYLVIRIFLGVEDHAGMDIPWSTSHWLPRLLGGTKFHDDHHLKFTANYASVFRVIDDVMGTSVTPA